jgi:hypothetical protein
MSNRAIRRAHEARLKRALTDRLLHEGWGFDESRLRAEPAYLTRLVGLRVHTRTLCSCSMCASPRKYYGNGAEGLTFQELKARDQFRDEET